MADKRQDGITDTFPRRAALTASLSALMPIPLAAQPPEGRGRGQGGGQRGNPAPVAPFTPDEIARVRAWFIANPAYRAQPLPPGIARNLARGKPLPPGIAKRYAPPDLVRLLTGRAGVEYLIIGGALVLAQAAGGVVVDIIDNALGR